MTLVGKIFAFAITILSVAFLVLSVVVFSTATNWKKKADDAQGRIAKLQGGVAKINVGGSTESEVKAKKMRVEDAMHATRAAH